MEIFALVNTILLLAGAVHVFLFKREFDAFRRTLERLKAGDVEKLIGMEIRNAANLKRLADHFGMHVDLPDDSGSSISAFNPRDHARSGVAGERGHGSAGGSW